jgi:chemotaxis protein MotB
MSDQDDDAPEEEVEEGAPAWLATFADLMSLLMCFFVLLLSFSEMDIQKYKQVAGSMKSAFGVQRDIKADQIPKAESVIMKEFSPGRPEMSIIDSVRQQTRDDTRPISRPAPAMPAEVDELIEKVREGLKDEIENATLEFIPYDYGVLVRVKEDDAFPSGTSEIQPGFVSVLKTLAGVLNDVNAKVVVSGHTDDVPIDTPLFPSNWVLSSARAASVVHQLTEDNLADPTQIEIRGYADTRPLVPNDSSANRARNRRVEIQIGYGIDGY